MIFTGRIDLNQGSTIFNENRNENEAVKDRSTVRLVDCTVVNTFIQCLSL